MLISAATGAGVLFAVTLIAVGVLWYSSRPKLWDAQALRVKRAKAEGLSRLNEKFDEVSSGVTFSVDVENTTATDVTLPNTLTTKGQTRVLSRSTVHSSN